ncbi:MAG: hypothetical protein EPN20_16370, partial [Magnetospirillum sp.]
MSIAFNISALMALVVAALVPMRPGASRDGAFWVVTALAVAGPAAWAASMMVGQAWQTSLSLALLVSIAASAALFAVVAAASPQ